MEETGEKETVYRKENIVTDMQPDLLGEETVLLNKMQYFIGDADTIRHMPTVPAKKIFDETIIDFLHACSRKILGSQEAKRYADVMTLGFWARKAALLGLKDRFVKEDGSMRFGRGAAFHIAPSNVPVNYAYSLFAGLLTGNANIVRLPSKDFPQVAIINQAILGTLEEFAGLKPYICLVRYDRERIVNDYLSSIADMRVVWGGDQTIAELRKSPLKPRACEVTFADRYSLAVIDSGHYLAIEQKERFAEEFYNDTFLTDQNACTSPQIVIWTGEHPREAKEIFWKHLHELARQKYIFQPIMGIDKLTSSYLAAARLGHVVIVPAGDNYIIRVQVEHVDSQLMDIRGRAGWFYEYDCNDILELRPLCDHKRCQTIGFLGNKEDIVPLIDSGIKGVDRIVPVGKTMDFDLVWDGYNLVEQLSRTIDLKIGTYCT